MTITERDALEAGEDVNFDDELERVKEEFEEQQNDDEVKEEAVLGLVTGLALVLRRIMQARNDLEESQREKSFMTRCLVNGRSVSMIIDGGSCTNVASTTMIEKLKYPTFQHPTPYKLHWLQDGDLVEVTKQARVCFSFGKQYKDEVLCNVIPMDACHILLGRPWKSDRDTSHSGRSNTYHFTHKNTTITLTPQNQTPQNLPSFHNEPKPNKNNHKKTLLLDQNQLVKAVEKGKEMYFLLVVEANEEVKEKKVPKEVEPLIYEFRDVFPEDLP